jgi:hypothetical protein
LNPKTTKTVGSKGSNSDFSKAEYARIVDEASKEMITEPIKDIID